MSPAFLDDDWVAGLVGAELPGVDATVAVTVGGAGRSDVTVRLVVAGGTVREAARTPAPDAAVTFSLDADDARAVLDGMLDPSVAYMQGRMKTAGDLGLVLAVLAATATDAWRAARVALAATTDG